MGESIRYPGDEQFLFRSSEAFCIHAMTTLRLLLLLWVACAHIGLTIAFTSTPRSTRRERYPVLSERANEDRDLVDYNDDAFGLVFLSSFVVEHDNVFAGTFGVLSAVAAILVRSKVLEYRPLMPGIVALGTVLTLTALRPTSLHPDNVTLLQLGVCSASLAWSIIQEVHQKAENTTE